MTTDRSQRVYQTEINGKRYNITKHPASEGMRISMRFISTGAAALVSAIDESDADAIKGAVQGIQRLLEAPDAAELARDILKHTMRDGRPLGDDVHFDEAYSGNYGEMIEALVEVSLGNGFMPGLDTLSRLGQRFGVNLRPTTSDDNGKPESSSSD